MSAGDRASTPTFLLASIVVALGFILMLVSGCSTFQQRAKDGSDLRGHCFQVAQLCDKDGVKTSPHGHKYTESQLDLRCTRLQEDATLWGYSCANYLP